MPTATYTVHRTVPLTTVLRSAASFRSASQTRRSATPLRGRPRPLTELATCEGRRNRVLICWRGDHTVHMARRAKTKSMAEIAEGVHQQKALDAGSVMPAADSAGSWIEVGVLRFTVFDDELTPEEARDLAEESRLVVWESCGCGVVVGTRPGKVRRSPPCSGPEFRS